NSRSRSPSGWGGFGPAPTLSASCALRRQRNMALSDEEVRQVASAVTAALGKPGPMPNTASFLQWVAGILAGIVVTLIGTWIAMSGKAVSIDQVQAVAQSELLNPVTNPYLVE